MTVKEFIKKLKDKNADFDADINIFWGTSKGDSIWLSADDVEDYQDVIVLRVSLPNPVSSVSYHTKLGELKS